MIRMNGTKDIHTVVVAQTDLLEVLGQFDPKLVKMCPAGERAEDQPWHLLTEPGAGSDRAT